MYNPLLEFIFGRKTQKTVETKFQHEWKRNAVLKNDVSTIMESGKIAMIECSLTEAMKIHSSYHQ